MRQKIDIGDLVEYDKYQALVLDRKTINPNYNTERVYHPDEYLSLIHISEPTRPY